jgi:peptide/nickel transport system substrate-binding protein
MTSTTATKPSVRVAFALAFAAAFAVVVVACAPEKTLPPRGVLVVSKEQTSSWTRNFNPLSPLASPRWPTMAGIYEPLAVFNSVRGEEVPWLATSWSIDEAHTRLRVTLREGVQWSDGQLFVADDVALTFGLLKKNEALDRRAVWKFLADVVVVDDHAVDFVFSRVFLPGVDDVLAQVIVPAHVWRAVADPLTFANETPVATGPFTEVTLFSPQVYELGRNPRYWQPGRPAVQALRFPALPGNDRANLALVFDEVDWAANFVPAIDRVYVARDPAHHAYWFPLSGGTIFLYPNTTRAPLSDVRVRKAISNAIDRALVVDVGLFGASRPADPTALSDGFSRWRDPDVAKAAADLRFDRARAEALLDDAGLRRGSDGFRVDASGARVTWTILTVAGWSDWTRAAEVIARGLRDVGVDVDVRTYDFGAWFEKLSTGDFDLSLGWSIDGPTPYVFYRWLLHPDTKRPLGESTAGNWHRFGDDEAGHLLQAFEAEADDAKRHALIADVERRFAQTLPAVPLFYAPSWAAYSTARFSGFPSKTNPYADPSPNKDDRGETLLVLTRLEPR